MNKQNNETEILLFALKERYESQHKIRERVQSVGFWSLGLLLSGGLWFLKSEYIFNDLQKAIAIIGISIGLYVLRFVYLNDLSVGFRSQQRVAADIEQVLGYYSSIKRINSSKPIYPIKWKKAGKKDCDGKFFKSTFLLLYVGYIFLIVSIIFNGPFC